MLHKIVIFSGGMDSCTLLHKVCAETWRDIDMAINAGALSREQAKAEYKLYALSFLYGQRHKRELVSAAKVCDQLLIPHQIINLPIQELLKGSALTDAVEMPEGVYDGENMRKTVVPGRNSIMLSIALGFAEGKVLSEGGNALIYYGAHSGDHHIYPDCRPEYVESMARTIFLASDGRVQLKAPFLTMDKVSILQHGLSIGMHMADYADTWTCYKGGEEACGVCGSCDERLAAFTANGVYDPLPYSSRGRWEAQQALCLQFAISLKK